MLIGQFCETYPPMMDGVGRVMLAYCQTLGNLGHRCIYVAPNNPSFPYVFSDCETMLYYGMRIPGEQYRIGLPRLSSSFRRKARKLQFDVVHAHSPFLAGREARRLARRCGAPLVATFHSKYYDDFYKVTHSHLIARFGVWYLLRFYNTCDEVWAVNNKTADVLRSYGFRGDILTMPNGTNPQTVTPQQRQEVFTHFSLREDVPTLIFAGQQDTKKNIEAIIHACAALLNDGIDFQFIMVGDGPDAKHFRRLVESLGLLDHFLFTGFLHDRPTLLCLYERADLMVFPSLYDNAPMVVREAAAMGTPALLVAGSCSAEGILHNQNGFLCQNSTESIAQGILQALPLCEKVGLRAKETIPIPWDQLMQKVLDRYRFLIAQKKNSKNTRSVS